MAVYRVQAPDGSILRIEGPDDATEEQIMQAAQAAFAQTMPETVVTATREGVDQRMMPGATAESVAEAQRQALISQIPGVDGRPVPPQPVYTPPTLGQRAIGAGEAALTTVTGGTTGLLGLLGGGATGLANAILTGKITTPDVAQMVAEYAMRGAEAGTYQPRTELGQEYAQDVAYAASQLPPILAVAGPPQAIAMGTRAAAVPIEAGVRRGAEMAREAPGMVAEMVREAPGMVRPGRVAAGAAPTPEELRRVTVAGQMPVPFEGAAGLTAGQRSRNFAQLQFEKEAAKIGETGAPLRERVGNQTAVMIQNFDAMVDRMEPMLVEPRDIGKAVSRAVVNKSEIARKRIRAAYKKAEEDGSMLEPVTLDNLATAATDVQRYEGVAGNVSPIRREAIRLGILAEDADGNLVPQPKPIADVELFRQFVNEATDWTDRRQALMARRINSAVDAGTEGKGGDAYRDARKLRENFANEFENVGLTAKLLSTKRGTNERAIAFDEVFDKIVINAPLEEMNKVRTTLITAGPEGKAAWNEMKAGALRYIKDRSLSASQRDEFGNPLLSPDKLNSTVRTLDREGKLDSLFGKKQAQQLRDLAELSIDIYTAPPGAVNFSNTASALRVYLETVLTMGVTGIPAPAATALKKATEFVKNRETKARIRKALEPIKEE
jgi:hypothetical protein